MTFGWCSRVALAGFAVLGVACVDVPPVIRVYQGHAVPGRYITPEAYAAYLTAVIAERSGDEKAARDAYAEVLRIDPEAILPPMPQPKE